MHHRRTALVSVGATAGTAIAVVAYLAMAPANAAPTQAVVRPQPVVAVASPTTVFAPCAAPAVVEGGACVTHRVVVRHVAAAPVAPVRQAAPAAAPVTAAKRTVTPSPAVKHKASPETEPSTESSRDQGDERESEVQEHEDSEGQEHEGQEHEGQEHEGQEHQQHEDPEHEDHGGEDGSDG